MPAFVAAFLGGLLAIAGSMVGQVLIGLGIALVTYTGLSTTFDWLTAQAVSSLSGLPAAVVGMMALMKVGSCISMVASAIAVRVSLQGLSGANGGTMKSFQHK